ncbi:hypothetical protein NBRC110019_00080 [Neptunitalea chrysea]|uniref:Outer membrane protein beta-barrel domain-containing protein n=1 Tax=Neptunitalea chrysea TaxID=1647581 RepID=A0A9W6B466_9FLAO|nr:porin family protein [Neptunitalea chrysea]GLB50969.1 hypothetical protein NBRC110019_00080 [Neptunitalea chrysea]
MRNIVFTLWVGVLGVVAVNAQASVIDSLHYKYVDDTYYEDQFYAGMVYNVLYNGPENLSQNNFSNGFLVGFIKDMPINKQRNKAIGLGVGYNNMSFYFNMRAAKSNGIITYDYIDSNTSYKRSKIETHAIEIPLEYRWRTSTATSTKFWRVYTGVRVSYAFSRISKYISETEKDVFENTDIKPLQCSGYISIGYNTWNLYGSFAFTKLFEDGAKIESTGEPLDMSYLSAGLMFYIL